MQTFPILKGTWRCLFKERRGTRGSLVVSLCLWWESTILVLQNIAVNTPLLHRWTEACFCSCDDFAHAVDPWYQDCTVDAWFIFPLTSSNSAQDMLALNKFQHLTCNFKYIHFYFAFGEAAFHKIKGREMLIKSHNNLNTTDNNVVLSESFSASAELWNEHVGIQNFCFWYLFIIFVVLGFEFRALHLLDRHSYHLSYSTSPFCVIFGIESHFMPGLDWTVILLFVLLV
jgi:hypothetical protein